MKDSILLFGDAEQCLRKIPIETADCCITSPPYYGLRDYGADGQIGLEESPEAYINRLATDKASYTSSCNRDIYGSAQTMTKTKMRMRR